MVDGEGNFDDFDWEAPVEKFENMLETKKNWFFDVDDFELLIDYYLDRGNFNKAKIALKFAQDQHPTSSCIKLRQAQLLLAQGKLNTALTLLDEVELLEPYNEELVVLKASIYSQQKKPDKAIVYLKKALDCNLENADDILLDLAFEYESIKQYEKAIECLHESLSRNPENEAALYELAYCYDLSDKSNDCIDYYHKFLDENPYSFIAWYNLGNAYCKIEDFEKSVQAFDYCIIIQENFSSAYFNKANSLMQLERWLEALDSYHEALLHEQPQAVTYTYIGECFEKLERYDEAIFYYKKAIKLDDQWGDAHLGVGIVKDLQNNLNEGLAHINKAIECDPDCSDYWYVYAEALKKVEKFEESEQAFLKVLEIEPDNESAYIDFIGLFECQALFSQAILIAEEALKLFSTSVELKYRYAALLFSAGFSKEAIVKLEECLQLDYNSKDFLFEYFEDAKNIPIIAELIELYK